MDLRHVSLTLMAADDEDEEAEVQGIGVSEYSKACQEFVKAQRPDASSVAEVRSMLFDIVNSWLRTRHGRRMGLKIGDAEAEIQTVDQLTAFLATAFPVNDKEDERSACI